MNPLRALTALLCVSASLLISAHISAEPGRAVELGVARRAIRNGLPVPADVFLSAEQQRAIGWLYVGVASRFCTATVISSSAVITARHCFEDEEVLSASQHAFALSPVGDEPSDEQEEIFPFSLADVALHPQLDVAVVRFVGAPFQARADLRPLPFNRAPIEGSFYENLLGRHVSVAGFGATFEEGARGRYFASVRVELITGYSVVVNGERRQGLCRGDSGGPLLAPGVDGQPTILAVVSKGDPCCAGVDQITRLDPISAWVDEHSGALLSLGPPTWGWPEGCWGVSQLSSCFDGQLLTCVGGEVVARSCEVGARCDYHPFEHRFACMPSCEGVPEEGVCVSNNLLRCVRGQVLTTPCGSGSRCGVIEDGRYAACVNDALYNIPADEGGIPLCIEDEEARLSEASEARFVASCAHRPTHQSPFTLILLLMTLFRVHRRLRSI